MMKNKLTIKYASLQGMYWAMAAVAMAFITPLLESKGFSSMEIGILNGVKYAVGIFVQLFIAKIADKYVEKIPIKYLVSIIMVLSGMGSFIFWTMNSNFVEALILVTIIGVTVNCASPLIDSLSIQYMNNGQNLNYTLSRACGSFTWAVSCIGVGLFSDYFGVNNILLLQIGFIFAFIIVALIMDKVHFNSKSKEKENISQSKNVHGFGYLIKKYPKFTFYLIGIMFVFMGYNMNFTFMIDVINKLGGSHTDYGVINFALAMAEIPPAIIFIRIRRHFKLDNLMLVCAIATAIKSTGTLVSICIPELIGFQLLEIIGFGLFYAGGVYFVMEQLPMQDMVKGVTMVNAATIGVGEAISSIISGTIKTHFGLEALIVASIIVGVISVCFMGIMNIIPSPKGIPRS